MNQFEFSKLVKNYLAANHPFLLKDVKPFEDGSFETYIKSPNGKLTLWLSTANLAITIGFEDNESKSGYNLHMSSMGANEPMEQLVAFSELVHSIVSNKEDITHSSISGFYLTDNLEKDLGEKRPDETLVVYKWDQL